MKILSIILLLSFSIILGVEESYSFKVFFKEIQKEGYYDMFVEIYQFYKKDVTIEVCNEFGYNRDNCEELVEVYIYKPGRRYAPSRFPRKRPTLESIIMNPKNYNIYAVKHNTTDIHNMIVEVKNKYDIKN